MGYDSFNPGSAATFARLFSESISGLHGGKAINGLPPHLQVIKRNGEPSPSLRRQFSKGKASAKKRGK